MDYDYRKQGSGTQRSGGGPNLVGYNPRYERSGSNPMTTSGSNSHLSYPKIAHPVGSSMNRAPPAPVSHSSLPSGAGGIRIAIKPEYRVGPAVQLIMAPNPEVPRSLFSLDFELERKILAEAERESLGWDAARTNGDSQMSDTGIGEDPVIAKYLEMHLNRDAVIFAVSAYGDNHSKVVEFVSSYNLLREMGFPSVAVAGALTMCDNDRESALALFV